MRYADLPHDNPHQMTRVKRNLASQISELRNAYDATFIETVEAPECLTDDIECSTDHFDSNQAQ